MNHRRAVVRTRQDGRAPGGTGGTRPPAKERAFFVVVTNKRALLPAGVSRGAAGRSAALVSPMKRVVALPSARTQLRCVRQWSPPRPVKKTKRRGAGARLSDSSQRERTSIHFFDLENGQMGNLIAPNGQLHRNREKGDFCRHRAFFLAARATPLLRFTSVALVQAELSGLRPSPWASRR